MSTLEVQQEIVEVKAKIAAIEAKIAAIEAQDSSHPRLPGLEQQLAELYKEKNRLAGGEPFGLCAAGVCALSPEPVTWWPSNVQGTTAVRLV